VTLIGRFYRWLYYRCYRYSVRGGGFFMHWASASILLLGVISMNLLVLIGLLVYMWPGTFLVLVSAPKWVAAGLVAVMVVQLSILGHNSRYKRIFKTFSKETPEEQRRGDLRFGWYLVLSMFSLIAMFAFAAVRSGSSS